MKKVVYSKETLKAVVKTLHESVINGLNANLTPSDCYILIRFMEDLMRRTKNRPPEKKRSRWSKTVTEFVEGVLEDLTSPGPPPGDKP